MRIYLVEDDANIRNLVLYTLNASGFQTTGFEQATSLYAAIKKELPHLILLDIMLPNEDGLSILRKLRKNAETKTIPVIMLTAKNSEYDKVLGLDAGADDYIAKPFGMMELVSRIKAVLRRAYPDAEKTTQLQVGDISLFPQQREVRVKGVLISLTMKEFDLLKYLMESPGYVFERDVLMEQIWDYNYEGESRTVDVHIRSLRQKLGSAGEAIETVRGVGYKIVPPSAKKK